MSKADTLPMTGDMPLPLAPWRIIIVDDSDDDVELACIELEHAGIDAQWLRVDGEPQLRDALASFAPDLVLSDMRMPLFSGLRALEMVRELAPGTPFVLLSGDRADTPRDASAAGPAPDARLSKDELGRLPALVRALLDPGTKRSANAP